MRTEVQTPGAGEAQAGGRWRTDIRTDRRTDRDGKAGVTRRAWDMEGGDRCCDRGRWEEQRKAGERRQKDVRLPCLPFCSAPVGTIPPGLGSHRLHDGVTPHEQVQGLRCTANDGRGQAVGEEVGPRPLP